MLYNMLVQAFISRCLDYCKSVIHFSMAYRLYCTSRVGRSMTWHPTGIKPVVDYYER